MLAEVGCQLLIEGNGTGSSNMVIYHDKFIQQYELQSANYAAAMLDRHYFP